MNTKGQSAGIILALFGLITGGFMLTSMFIIQSQFYSSLSLSDYTPQAQHIISKSNTSVIFALGIASMLDLTIFVIMLKAPGIDT